MKEVVAKDPGNTLAWITLGNIYLTLEDEETALEYYNTAIAGCRNLLK